MKHLYFLFGSILFLLGSCVYAMRPAPDMSTLGKLTAAANIFIAGRN